MASNEAMLVVPILSPSGQVHFVSLSKNATVSDAIEALKTADGIVDEVLGDLDDGGYGWALQRVQREETNRNWEEEELEALDEGTTAHILHRHLKSLTSFSVISGRVTYSGNTFGAVTIVESEFSPLFRPSLFCLSTHISPPYPSPSNRVSPSFPQSLLIF